jgi:hypothetical protein
LITDLERFLAGEKGQRRANLLMKRLGRYEHKYSIMLGMHLLKNEYHRICILHSAIVATQDLIKSLTPEQEGKL